mmetsp:Transcript_38335/g.59834  ORF Transcript_38335/g.59834 Transcript_38335/m.59834 type:complete len:281 (-) Transcript_38335:701-1543(-)
MPCLFVDELAQGLASSVALEHLTISNVDVSVDIFGRLCTAMRAFRLLKSLELNLCGLGNPELNLLCNFFLEDGRICQLQRLQFSNSGISSEGLRQLSNVLEHATNLTSLNLAYNSGLGSQIEASLVYLAEIFSHCPLRSLNLTMNYLNLPTSPFGSCVVIEKIRSLTGLTSLNLSFGLLTQVEQGIELAESIGCCSLLTDLRLSSCFGQHSLVTESRISERLAESLTTLRELKTLHLDSNRFGDEGLANILASLTYSSTLAELGIANTGSSRLYLLGFRV